MEPAIRDLPFLDEFDLLNKIDIKEWRCVIDDTTMLDEEEMMDRFMEESINSMIDRINFLLELSKTKWSNTNQRYHPLLNF